MKANNIKSHIKREFVKNKDVTDENAIAGKFKLCLTDMYMSGGSIIDSYIIVNCISLYHGVLYCTVLYCFIAMRANAVRGLANYLMIENSQKDVKFQATQNKFMQSEVDSLKKMSEDEKNS